MSESSEEILEAIEDGMVTILWGDAWGKHAEKHGCADLPEEDEEEDEEAIAELVPDAPDEAYEAAKKLAAMYKKTNGKNLAALFMLAKKADTAAELDDPEPEDFGSDLAFMALGEEDISWFDGHAKFELRVPSFDNAALETLADEQCEEEVEETDAQPEGVA